MFGSLGAPELIIIGVVIILIFGVGKLSGLGKDLGGSIKEFRRAVKEEEEPKPQPVQQAQVAAPPPVQQYSPAPPVQQYSPPPPPPATTASGDPKSPNIF